MEHYIRADDYELWMTIKNGLYIPVKATEDGKTIPKKPNEFGQTSTHVSHSVSP